MSKSFIFYSGVDVAFNNRIRTLAKVSYDDAINIQYGIYDGFIWEDMPYGLVQVGYKGCLTINLKPTKDGIDWFYNLRMLPKKTEHGKVHRGYYKEIEKYWTKIREDIINLSVEYKIDLSKGIILAGRSKGAGEALLLVPHLSEIAPVLICVGIEPLKVCDEDYSAYIASLCKEIPITTSYKNDIVTGVPFWFKFTGMHIQNGKRTLGLSVKDHKEATTREEIWYEYIKEGKI
jgi:hypothetical protein